MEHAEAREILEVAAVEPGGLDRLMAGDTPPAAALAGHLAACPECTAELDRLRRAASIIRTVVAATPDPGLKARTLAYVATVGRDRSGGAAGTAGTPVERQPTPTDVPATTEPPAATTRRGGPRRPVPGWVAGLAAALVVALAGSAFLLGRAVERGTAERQAAEIATLSRVTTWSLRIDAEPDARRVVLAGSGPANGSLLYSPGTTELVVVASDLPPAPAGSEYRCWVEIDGVRTSIGRMFPGGALDAWAGEAAAVAGATGSATFGVSLVPVGAVDATTDPVIAGSL